MHTQFVNEAATQWQFPKHYKAFASPQVVANADVDNIENADDYDIDKEWKQLRQQQAEACWRFVQHHQAKCLEFYEQKVNLAVWKQSLRDATVLKLTELGMLDQGYQDFAAAKVERLAYLVYHKLVPDAVSRMQKEAGKKKKRDDALLEAETVFRSMDTKELIAAAVLESNCKLQRPGQTGTNKKKSHTISDQGALGFLCKDSEELKKKFNLTITTIHDKPTKQTKLQSKPEPTQPKGKGKGKGKGKSDTKGKGKGKSDAKGKGKSANAKGKGKGKDAKGKGKGKGKSSKNV
jgi:hypothetical protein